MALPPEHVAAMEAAGALGAQRKQAFGLPLSPDEVRRGDGRAVVNVLVIIQGLVVVAGSIAGAGARGGGRVDPATHRRTQQLSGVCYVLLKRLVLIIVCRL
jgi:hypothetical protein